MLNLTSVAAGVWLLIFIVMLVFEIATLGLTSIWFAVGALAAFITAILNMNIAIQIGVFLFVSGVLLALLRPLAAKFLNKNREKTNVDALIGKIGYVTIEINNLKGQGEINLSGQIWTARSADDTIISVDSHVEITALEGVKAIVKKVS